MRDPRVDPLPGDVLVSRGVTREIRELGKTVDGEPMVLSRFTSPRWLHTEWATVATFRKWARAAEVLAPPEEAAHV